MFVIFSGLKNLFKLGTVCTEGTVFRLHCKATVLFLLCASILLSCRQYFGDPIECVHDAMKDHKHVLENYCWIHSTFTLPHAWDSRVGIEVPHPGVDNTRGNKPRQYHAYYQWVAFVLLLQGIFFYLPHYLWKRWENGIMKSLVLNLSTPVLPTEDCSSSYKLLTQALHSHWGQFSGYFMKYILCELLTFINVLCQMKLLDAFFDNAFSNFGAKVIEWSEWDQHYRTDPLVRVFPRMTKCLFHYYGSSGDLQKVDALCLLPLNILNEKIFVFLWFWMVLLACLTGLVLIYRLCLFFMPMLRYSVLKFKAPIVSPGIIDKLVQNAKVSDWFVLYLLSKNLTSLHYRCVVSDLTAALEKKGYIPLRSLSKNEDTAFVS